MTGREGFSPEILRLLDGEIPLSDLPAEQRAEGEAALRMLRAGPAATPAFSPWFEQRVMAEVRRRPRPGANRFWRWLSTPLEVRVRLWALAGAVALALVAVFARRPLPAPLVGELAQADSVYVRFVLYAPDVHQVALAGSFNEWDPNSAPLAPTGTPGLWSTTIALPVGQHLYAFVLDGQRWLPDPAAPTVDDGFGRRNSVMTVSATRGRVL